SHSLPGYGGSIESQAVASDSESDALHPPSPLLGSFFYVRLTIWRQHLSKGEIQFPREMCENVQCGEDLPELDRANVRSSEVWRGQVRLAQASGDTQLADVRAHTVVELA